MDTPQALSLPLWAQMWGLAAGLYALAKAASWSFGAAKPIGRRGAAYCLGWPGMDPQTFLSQPGRAAPERGEWLFAAAKLAFGVIVVWLVVPLVPSERPLLAGWLGMIGCVFALHFGLFHLLSCWWRSRGYNAEPLMDWPIASQSVAEFWGRRWNRAFRDLTHRLLFRPLEPRWGSTIALLISFLASGLVHDLVISLPAGGGYGGPTCYFLLQAIGIASERSRLGRRIGLRHGFAGRLFAVLVIVGPLSLLFHEAFVLRVFVPFLHALGAVS